MVRASQAVKPKMLTSTPLRDKNEASSTLPAFTPIRKYRKSITYSHKKCSFIFQRQSSKSSGEVKRKHRFRPGTVALQEIRRFQKGGELLVPRLPFSRLIREILSMHGNQLRIQGLALMALQEAAECYVTTVLELANLCSIHARRVTIFPRDIKLVRRIRGDLE
ncbi:uncharacterized protein [Cherax quadricarinatus]|uniref:uncharacterized protein isoform X1 n=1 Tax=Cherax quadricarinatus TaxID=27406 RepID=UPI00387EA9C3